MPSPLPLQSCDSWIVVKENPDKKMWACHFGDIYRDEKSFIWHPPIIVTPFSISWNSINKSKISGHLITLWFLCSVHYVCFCFYCVINLWSYKIVHSETMIYVSHSKRNRNTIYFCVTDLFLLLVAIYSCYNYE